MTDHLTAHQRRELEIYLPWLQMEAGFVLAELYPDPIDARIMAGYIKGNPGLFFHCREDAGPGTLHRANAVLAMLGLKGVEPVPREV